MFYPTGYLKCHIVMSKSQSYTPIEAYDRGKIERIRQGMN